MFDRKEMKYSDSMQFEEALEKIAKEVFEEDLKHRENNNEISKETEEKRIDTVEKEYVKYRAELNLSRKEKPLSFREFASQKYSLQDIESTNDLEHLVEEEIKGMKK